LIVTFARKRSHDAQYAADPIRLIQGRVPVPIVNLENYDLVRRHIYALALSEFLRREGLPGDTAVSFFGLDPAGDRPSESFHEWLAKKPVTVFEAISKLGLPEETLKRLGVAEWAWVELLAEADDNGRGAWLSVIQNMFTSEDESLEEWILELKKDIKSKKDADRIGQAITVRDNR
jgi:hypothetical protein